MYFSRRKCYNILEKINMEKAMKKLICFMLAASLVSAVACGSESSGSRESSAPDTQATAAPDEALPAYVYPEVDYEGYEFTFLNVENPGWANPLIAPEEITGEQLSDAMFERNARISERFNVTIVEEKTSFNDITATLRRSVSAGDDTHDVFMLPLHHAGAVIAEGCILDLHTVDSLKLDAPWWDQAVVDSVELMSKLYMVTSDISFFPFESTWAIFFNEDTFTDLGLEFPYELVREGRWTLDKLTEYARAGAMLGGEEAYLPYKVGQSSRYGFASHHKFPLGLIYGSGGAFATLENGKGVFTADSEKMFGIYEKIAALTGEDGAYYNWDFTYGSSQDITIATEFMKGRYMMCSETLGYLETLRKFDGSFGVLPIPKYDEAQESYRSIIAENGTTMTTIAVTATDPERTGVILDALAYDSFVNLMNPYYNTYLTQKGVRNEDSAEMLAIIRETRGIATDIAFGWTTALHESIMNRLSSGDIEIASAIESAKASVLANIESSLSSMTE